MANRVPIRTTSSALIAMIADEVTSLSFYLFSASMMEIDICDVNFIVMVLLPLLYEGLFGMLSLLCKTNREDRG